MFNNLTETERTALTEVFSKYREGSASRNDFVLSPIKATVKSRLSDAERKELEDIGYGLIRQGKVAAVTMAGGQGTRLGHDGPKGTFVLDPETGKSLFEILCDRLKKFSGGSVLWYIMTSHINNDETVDFFEKHGYFGYPRENIRFFIQDRIAVMDTDGRPVYDENGDIMRTPNGNGGCISSLASSGSLDEMKKAGIEYVFICGIDNCLAMPADPVFAGFAEKSGCEIAAKSVIKNCAKEKAGTLCYRNGRPIVVEYTEIPEEYAEMKDENGDFVYGDVNILSYFMKIGYVERMVAAKPEYHVAVKKLKYYTYEGGALTEHEGECIKLELFLFDLFEKAESMSVLRIERENEFAPVKNKTGVDSAETALEMLRKASGKISVNEI